MNEKDLLQCIKEHDVEGAIIVYKLLNKKELKPSEELVQTLFEFVSYYNSEKVQDDEFTEARHFERDIKSVPSNMEVRTSKGTFADELYQSIENKTFATFNTRVRGLAKSKQLTEAKAIFDKMVDDKMPIDVETFNTIISVQGELQKTFNDRWQRSLDILKQMNESKIKPNIQTLNTLLGNIAIGGLYAILREHSLSVLSEFKNIGIEPNLGTWYLILKIFCKEQTPTSHILIDILNEIEGKEFKCETKSDGMFFQKAMITCYNHIKDINTAKRVDKLLNTGDNYKFIGDFSSETIYYRNYLNVLLTGPFDDFLKAYNEYVPNLYSIDIQIFGRIIQRITENGQIQHIPLFFSNAIMANLINSRFSKTLEQLIEMMVKNPPNPKLSSHAELPKQFCEIAWEIWIENLNMLERQQEDVTISKFNNAQWIFSAQTIGNIVHLCHKAGETQKANEIMDIFLTNYKDDIIYGTISFHNVKSYIEICIKEDEKDLAIRTLEYAVDKAFDDSVQLGKLIMDNMKLNERDLRKLKNLLGESVLKSKKKQR